MPHSVDLTGPFLGRDALAARALTPTQLRSPLVRRLFRGVYLPAAVPLTHSTRARAATLVLPADAVVTGTSALSVLGADLARTEDPVVVAVPERARCGPIAGMRVERTAIRPGESRPWEGARLATAERAAFDALRHLRLPWAVGTLDVLVRGRVVTADAVAALATARLETGVGVVRDAVRLCDPRAESIPESVVRVLLVEAGLRPTPQLPVVLPDGTVTRVDLGFDAQRVAVEYDGAWHALREQLSRDRSRHNALQASGWTVVTLTAADLRRDPRVLVALVTAALDRRAA